MDSLNGDFKALMEIADLSPKAVFIYSIPRKTILYSNPSCIKMFGLTKDASEGEIITLLTRVDPSDRNYVKSVFSKLLEQLVVLDIGIRLQGTDDTYPTISCNAHVVGNGSAIVVYIRDISKVTQHEKYLVEFGARKNTVLDTLTHHISGALHLMKHFSAEAAKLIQQPKDNPISTYLGLLDRNNARCLQIIDDLLNREHTKSPEIYVKRSRVDIIDIVAILHNEFGQSYPHRTFVFQRSKDSVFVSTDEVKFLQVVNNLVSNAIKFSSTDQPIEISVTDDPTQVMISVKDYGIGIPEKLWPFIFERQSGAGRKGLNGEKSYELGLSICRNLVNLMGGRMWFESKEDEGSTFYFNVPK